MKSWRILSTFVLAGALLASPAYAGDRLDGAQTLDRSDGAQTLEAPQGKIIEGKVAAVEPENGRFVLDTDDGPISLVTSPEELAGVQVGDVVRVSLMLDDSE
jgi:hypothetical protein